MQTQMYKRLPSEWVRTDKSLFGLNSIEVCNDQHHHSHHQYSQFNSIRQLQRRNSQNRYRWWRKVEHTVCFFEVRFLAALASWLCWLHRFGLFLADELGKKFGRPSASSIWTNLIWHEWLKGLIHTRHFDTQYCDKKIFLRQGSL